MNIKALRAFRAVVAQGSLSAAADTINLSLPATSRLISTLEGELRLVLFQRSGRRLVPTPEGLKFFSVAGRILDNLDEIPRIAAEIRGGRVDRLRIVALSRVTHALVSPTVAAFLRTNPAALISVDVRARREASEWLVVREFDLGIGPLPLDHPEIHTEPLLSVRAMVVAPIGHPLCEQPSLSAEELAGWPFVGLMSGLLLRDLTDDFFRSAGVTPNLVAEVAASPVACSLVSNGVGLTLADEFVVSELAPTTVCLIPTAPERWMRIGFFYPKFRPLSKVGEAFVDALRAQAQKLSETSSGVRLDTEL